MRPGTPAWAADWGQQSVWEPVQSGPRSSSSLPSRADGDKLGEVRGRLLRGDFPELNSGSLASWSDLPSQAPSISCSLVPDGLFQIGPMILFVCACCRLKREALLEGRASSAVLRLQQDRRALGF